MSAKHTPTPWWNESGVIHAKGPNWTEESHSCVHVARVDEEDEDSQDAEFIVRAANAHDSLVEALEAVTELLELLVLVGDEKPEKGSPCQLARAALSKAKGE